MASTSRKSSPIKLVFLFCHRRYEVHMYAAVCNSCKQKVSRGGATTNDYCFISCYFISFKIKSNRYNLNVKYRIGYRYRQISVIKNRNIGISVFSHIGASLKEMCTFSGNCLPSTCTCMFEYMYCENKIAYIRFEMCRQHKFYQPNPRIFPSLAIRKALQKVSHVRVQSLLNLTSPMVIIYIYSHIEKISLVKCWYLYQ